MENIIGRTRRPDIRFYRSGKIEISANVARKLRLAEGDIINVGLENGDYYVYATHIDVEVGRHHARCRATNPGRGHLRAFSRRLTSAVMQRCGEPECASLAVGELMYHPVFGEILPLILRAPENINYATA